MTDRLRGTLLVLLAAALWGTLGIFYNWGRDVFGLTAITIVFWRAALAALALSVGIPLLGKASLFKVRRDDLPMFLVFGLLGISAFYILYIYAIFLVGIAVAVVLLYTAPVFVALMAWRFLGEGLGPRKVVALGLTLMGCVLVARAYNPELLRLNFWGILCGLGSGFTYALYSILGKVSLHRGYSIATMSFYIYATGTLGLLVIALFLGPEQLVAMGTDVGAWGLLLTLALAQTLGAVYAYTAGLRYMEAGVASILATFEPVVAALLAFFVLHEALEPPQIVGGVLILAAVLLLQMVNSSR